jgi:hypothetical protein
MHPERRSVVRAGVCQKVTEYDRPQAASVQRQPGVQAAADATARVDHQRTLAKRALTALRAG